MSKGKNQCYFVKQKDGELLKFSYGDQQDIYYQMHFQQIWSEKKCVYKGCLEYFYVIEDWKGRINVFCQDICGDIILCTLEETKWKVKILLQFNILMPRYVKAFIDKDDIHLLYHIVEKHNYAEVLVHQTTKDGTTWSSPKVISRVDNSYLYSYNIFQDCDDNVVLVNTIFSEVYHLTSKTFYTIEGKWGKEEIIHTSIYPYGDFALYVEENRKHYLFITQDHQINRLIYQNRKVGLQKEKTLFQHHKIDSCIFVLTNKELVVLWICENKLYGCQSTDHGENFSRPKIYDQFDKLTPIKGYYQQWGGNMQNKSTLPHMTYVINQNQEYQIYSMEVLKDYQVIEVENQGSLIDEIDHTKAEQLQRIEKEELQRKLENANIELRRVNEEIKVKQNEESKLKNQIYKEKEKNKLSISYNNSLKEKNSYLEVEIWKKDEERIIVEKQLAEITKENEELKQQLKQLNVIKIKNLNSKQTMVLKNMIDSTTQTILPLARWFLEEENQ